MSMLQKAIEVATEALKGKEDQTGRPYVEHALRVMEKMDTEEEKIVAVLHDVLEDSELSMGDLKLYGFSKTVLEAVEQLTKRKDMTYYEYIEDISCSELASKVKVAEVDDNKDVVRVNKMSFKTYSLEERAQKTIKLLHHEPVETGR
ncbi:MAG: GTP pyrophosphokinase [Lachnospiraceae bacterium]|nr:GTP pyrophosphokinase [Lachnospiraceae bacterium]